MGDFNTKTTAFLTVPIADYGDLGPAMQALPSDRMRNFVMAMIETGGRDYTKCARLAGYAENISIKVTGWRLAHDARIQEAVREEGQRRLGTGIGVATNYLLELIENPVAGAKDRLRAAEMLFNRVGMPAQTEHKVSVEHTMSETAILDKITLLAKKHGLDPQALLGEGAPKQIEGSFEEIPSEDFENWTAL